MLGIKVAVVMEAKVLEIIEEVVMVRMELICDDLHVGVRGGDDADARRSEYECVVFW